MGDNTKVLGTFEGFKDFVCKDNPVFHFGW